MRCLISHFYRMPLQDILLVVLMVWIADVIFTYICPQKIWRRINVCIFYVTIGLIFYMTIVGRKVGSNFEIILVPFSSLQKAKSQPEIYRTLLMNVILFLPFGLSFPYILSELRKHKVQLTIICAGILSLMIEFLQFYFSFGRCEVDDVIMNTIGAIIGVVVYYLSRKIKLKLDIN